MSSKIIKPPIKKVIAKAPASPRPTSPKKIKKKLFKNTFELLQFKKMIGKGLVAVHKGIPLTQDETESKKLREKILSGTVKTIGMSGVINGGILYIFDGIERLIALNSITYADIKKTNLDIDILVNQYSKEQ